MAPVLQGELQPSDLFDLAGLNYTVELTPETLELPYGTYAGLPPLAIDSLGPFSYGEDERFTEVRFQEAVVRVTLENQLPFEIGTGSVLSVDNPDGTNILQTTLPSPLLPGGTYSAEVPANTPYLQENLTLSFFNFSTTGTPDTFELTPLTKVDITFELLDYTLERIFLKPGPEFTLAFDTDFAFETQGIPQEVLDARFTLLAENYYPLRANTQVYLVDSLNREIDSLFTRAVDIPAAQTDGQGNLIASRSARDSIRLAPRQLSELLKTNRLRGEARFQVPPSSAEALELDATRAIGLQLIGDFKLRVSTR